MPTAPQDVCDALTQRPPSLIVGHVNPDADCLGSMFALMLGMRQNLGHSASCALPAGSVSTRMQFLVEWATPDVASAQHCRQSTCVAVCDTAKEKRANMPEKLHNELTGGRTVINIDHHASNTEFGEINWVEPHASSTCEMIYRLFKAQHWPFNETIASLLYAGLHGDTVGFSLPNTSDTALSAAAELVSAGARVGEIGERVCRSLSEQEFDLRRIIYDNTRMSPSQRIAFSTASAQEITRAGCSAADIDDQVEIPRALDGALIAMLFTEGTPQRVRINLRSKADVGVLELAIQLGGGGHDGAAGAIYHGSIEEALAEVLPMAEKYLDLKTTNTH